MRQEDLVDGAVDRQSLEEIAGDQRSGLRQDAIDPEMDSGAVEGARCRSHVGRTISGELDDVGRPLQVAQPRQTRRELLRHPGIRELPLRVRDPRRRWFGQRLHEDFVERGDAGAEMGDDPVEPVGEVGMAEEP